MYKFKGYILPTGNKSGWEPIQFVGTDYRISDGCFRIIDEKQLVPLVGLIPINVFLLTEIIPLENDIKNNQELKSSDNSDGKNFINHNLEELK